jgi:hypothetical protein
VTVWKIADIIFSLLVAIAKMPALNSRSASIQLSSEYVGHDSSQEAALGDPADSFLRLRMVFTILQASGHYFTKGFSHNKLKRYLLFLQHYVLTKEALPLDLDLDFDELLKKLQPDACRYGHTAPYAAHGPLWKLCQAACIC